MGCSKLPRPWGDSEGTWKLEKDGRLAREVDDSFKVRCDDSFDTQRSRVLLKSHVEMKTLNVDNTAKSANSIPWAFKSNLVDHIDFTPANRRSASNINGMCLLWNPEFEASPLTLHCERRIEEQLACRITNGKCMHRRAWPGGAGDVRGYVWECD
jgi:hypothetical protein